MVSIEDGAVGRFAQRPWLYAGALALGFFLFSGTYIVASGDMAAASAQTLEELQRAELIKGLVFMGASSFLLFSASGALFQHLARRERALAESRTAFLVAQQKATSALLAASVAHDFKNVLLVIGASAEEILEESRDPQVHQLAKDIGEGVRRGADLARRFGTMARGAGGEARTEVDVSHLAADTLALLGTHRLARGCTLRLHVGAGLRARIYPAMLRQVLNNLVLNAIDAVEGAGEVEVRLRSGADGLEVEVHDAGPGITPEVRAQLFQAFFTTKREGTGLGLLSVKTCAELHGGEVEVTTSPLGGACFRVTFPEPSAP